MPTDVVYRKTLFTFGDLTLGPMPWLLDAFGLNEPCVVGIRDLVLVHIEGVHVDPVRRIIIRAIALKQTHRVDEKECDTAHPIFTGGN